MNSIKTLSDMNTRWSIVTGASGHLGIVIAETLAELGSNLILVDRVNSNLEEKANAISSIYKSKIECYFVDLESSPERVVFLKAVKKHPEINVLVNNAAFVGTSDLKGWGVPFSEQTVDTWRRAMEVNLTSVFELTQGLIPQMQKTQGANIINIASIYGQYGPKWELYEGTNMANPAAYSASKGGLIQFTKWLATTVSPDIRVNSVSPGGIFRNQPESFVKKYEQNTPLKRMATEDDFRGVIAFLASDLSSYITGQNISVDGGWGVW
jgi:NAD(P)-dependent dehydrogenase (short-subunit alcohol dehydrogenase family)